MIESPIVGVLRRRWPLLLLGVSIGIAAAAAYWRYTPPTFESSAQILVMRKDPQLASTATNQANRGESEINDDLLATHVQLIQSKRIVEDALREAGLAELPSIVGKLKGDETAVDYVIDNLRVTRGGSGQAKTAHVLNVAFRHSSAEDAERVVDAVVDRYQKFLTDKFQDVNEEAASLIARAREGLEGELKAAEASYVEARKAAPLLWNGEKSSNVHLTRYEQVQTELSDLRLREADTRSRLAVVEEAAKDPKSAESTILEQLALIDEKSLERVGLFSTLQTGGANSAAFQALAPQLAAGAKTEHEALLKLLAEERTMAAEFGPNHPKVTALRQQIAATREFLSGRDVNAKLGQIEDTPLDLKQIVPAYTRLLRNDLSSLERRVKELESVAAAEQEAAKELVSFELEDQTRRKEIDRKQQLFDAVVERLREINLARDYGGFVNELIAPAAVGDVVWPALPLCLAFGMVLGFGVGGGAATLAELRDRSFRNVEDVARTLDLPVLSQIPDLRLAKKAGAVDRSSGIDEKVCAFYRPKSREAEVFRSLRTSLLFTARTRKLQVIQLTSPFQGDGKSTTTANLAVSLAQLGRRVLLVDCDLRRPRVHSEFGLKNEIGFADVLSGAAEPWDAVLETAVEGLTVLTAGKIPANPAELLGSEAFASFLGLARERYDFVLLDTSPVLAVSDPCVVAPQADGVLLVVRVSKEGRPQAIRTKEMLDAAGAALIGTIVNGWDAGSSFAADRYGYSYGYGGYGYRRNGSYLYYTEDSTGPEAATNGRRQSLKAVRPANRDELATNGRHG